MSTSRSTHRHQDSRATDRSRAFVDGSARVRVLWRLACDASGGKGRMVGRTPAQRWQQALCSHMAMAMRACPAPEKSTEPMQQFGLYIPLD
jgi:hypothetical protein